MSSSHEQEMNRTEQATPFKLEEARKHGQVAKSLDFNSMFVLWGMIAGIAIWGGSSWTTLADLCSRLLLGAASFDVTRASSYAQIATMTISLLAPLAVLGMLCGILGNLIQTGPVFSTFPLKPKFERLNPIAGFKRIFNKRMLFEALKSVIKLGFFAALVYAFVVALWHELPGIGRGDLASLAAWLERNSTALLFRLGLALIAIALLDLAYVRWQFGRQMMMSRRELKEEIKRREGDPLIRAKLRELQRENLKQSRSMGRVPEADVLITNPEHFAVALRYVRGAMEAPLVLAKGADHWAVQMKGLARRHGVPIHEQRRLARHLFRHGEIDRAIPADVFVDVARVYAELEAARTRAAHYAMQVSGTNLNESKRPVSGTNLNGLRT